MEKFILLICVLFLNMSFAQVAPAGTNSVKRKCHVQAKTAEALKLALNNNSKGMVLATVTDALMGELDPYVLGDGGLLALQTNSASLLIYEERPEASFTSSIKQYSDSGFKFLALKESCFSHLNNKKQQTEMIRLASKFLGAKAPFLTMKLN